MFFIGSSVTSLGSARESLDKYKLHAIIKDKHSLTHFSRTKFWKHFIKQIKGRKVMIFIT